MKRFTLGIGLLCLTQATLAEPSNSSGLKFQIAPEMPKNLRVRSEHGAEYNQQTGYVRYLNGVEIYTDTGLQIFSNKALMDTKQELIHFTGDVNIYQNSILHRGEKATYNYGTEKLITNDFSTSLDPILLDSESLESVNRGNKTIYVGKNASLTTHDRIKPNFHMKASSVAIDLSDRVRMKGVKIYTGETPFFYLPYLSQATDPRLGYHFVPGSRSNWGPFLLNSYGIMLGGEEDPATGMKEDQWLLSEWHFDLRARRGVGIGLDLTDTRLDENENLGWFRTYYTHDKDPSISRTKIPREDINKNRYRFEVKYRNEWKDNPGWTNIVDTNFTLLSDDYFLEDFDPRNYTLNPQPDNIIGYQRRSERTQLGLFARVQLNTFHQADTRLPEAYWDIAKQPILGSSFLHEGSTSLGYYKENLADRDRGILASELATGGLSSERQSQLERLLGRHQFGRFHTYQELTRPIVLTSGLSITPRIGGGFSQYWDSGDDRENFSTPHGYIGVDTGMKFTRTFSSVQNHSWGLDQLMHVLHPYANLSVLSTKELGDDRVKIDRLTPTERPRPYDIGRYTAIDDFRNWSIIRLGARNQLLTKRDQRSHSWLTLDTYIDTFLNDPEFQRDFSNLYNDLRWHPVPWGSLNFNTQFPVSNQGFTELTSNALFWPHENIELEIGHSFLQAHPTIDDSNLIHTRGFFRLTPKWSVGAYQQWQLDDNTLERQEYSFYRNFQSWTAGLGLYQRDNRLNKEYGALLNVSLNALPSVSLPFSLGLQ